MIIQQAALGGNLPAGVSEALRLADSNWSVFPLNPATGTPYANTDVAAALGIPEPPKGSGGVHLASAHGAAIHAMWSRWPDAHIGVATGQRSGLYVLDVDRKAGRDGFAALIAKGLALPNTFWTDTRSGGRHYFFAIPRDGLRRFVSDAGIVAEGVDRRGDGGYVRWCGAAFGCSLDPIMTTPPDWMLTGSFGNSGTRQPLGSIPAPSFDAALKALYSIDPNELDRDGWIRTSFAYRQSATGIAPDYLVQQWWLAWCAQYDRDDRAENDTQWRSADNGTDVGWPFLLRAASANVQAELLGVTAIAIHQPGPVVQSPASVSLGEILTPVEQQVWFAGCALIGPENRIMDGKGQVYDPGAFNATFGGKKFIIDATGKLTDEPWKAATRGTQFTIPKVDGTTFRTDVPTGHIAIDELGRSYVNTYIPARIERMDGDVTPFLNHVAALLPDPNDQRILIEFMAHNAKYPGHKIPWAPLIQSTEGAGKNLIKYVMTHVIGDNYTYPANSKELTAGGGKFNDWMHRKLFLIADEIRTDDRRDMIEVLKPMISERTLEMQAKGLAQRKADNVANWLFFSNYKDAIPVNQNSRRFAIFYSAIQTKEDALIRGMDDAYFRWLYDDWLGASSHKFGLKVTANYLLNHPIERGAIPMRAPNTSSMGDAIIESRGWLEQMIAEAVDDQRNGFRCGWISTAAVGTLLRERRKEAAARSIGQALGALGYQRIGQLGRGYFQDDPINPNRRGILWHVNPNIAAASYGQAQGYE
ncbi:bifunctional DNA primase/polymerase [Sphingopyxis sp.]|jgi:hypothetical protein|uniref:bifunctional DNA primase/polymerase n=1 Tax=Sphingopyxis sp. TaxID=1908224 RepID=UPI003F70727A